MMFLSSRMNMTGFVLVLLVLAASETARAAVSEPMCDENGKDLVNIGEFELQGVPWRIWKSPKSEQPFYFNSLARESTWMDPRIAGEALQHTTHPHPFPWRCLSTELTECGPIILLRFPRTLSYTYHLPAAGSSKRLLRAASPLDQSPLDTPEFGQASDSVGSQLLLVTVAAMVPFLGVIVARIWYLQVCPSPMHTSAYKAMYGAISVGDRSSMP
jgi:hypothetical protein